MPLAPTSRLTAETAERAETLFSLNRSAHFGDSRCARGVRQGGRISEKHDLCDLCGLLHCRGVPAPWLLRLLNQRKYPASQLFLLMTVGPTIALLPLAERARGPVGRILAVFGRVPLFYYLLHIPVIHAAALVVSVVREGRVNPLVICQPSDAAAAGSSGIHVESAAPLRCVRDRRLVVVHTVRVVAGVKASHPNGILRYL